MLTNVWFYMLTLKLFPQQQIFQLCAKNGLVGSQVIKEIEPVKERLLPKSEIPLEWTVNVR